MNSPWLTIVNSDPDISVRFQRLLSVGANLALATVFLCVVSPSAFSQRPPAPVRVDAVREELVTDHRPVTGNLRAVHRAQIATREKGLVSTLFVREGDTVKAGEALAQLDSKQLQLDLVVMKAERLPLSALVDEAGSSLVQAERDLRALTALAKQNAANPKELEDATTRVIGAKARKASAEAQLLVLNARQAKLEKRIDDMRVSAPFDGTVVRRATDVGAWLAEGAPVVELVSAQKLEVWVQVPQDLFAAVSENHGPIDVQVGSAGKHFTMTDYVAVPDVDRRGRAFSIVGPAPAGIPLAAGMSVLAMVPTSEQSKRLTIHRDAIMRNAVGSFVYGVVPGGEDKPAAAAPMDIRVLFQTETRAVIESGSLRPGMNIVIEGNERLYPMAPIQPLAGEGEGKPQ